MLVKFWQTIQQDSTESLVINKIIKSISDNFEKNVILNFYKFKIISIKLSFLFKKSNKIKINSL